MTGSPTPKLTRINKMGKRSQVDPDRLKLLRSQGAVYLITCQQSEYSCNHLGGRCSRGFFSLFLQAVYGIQFAEKLNLAYQVDFGNLIYCYTEPDRFSGNGNFWEYYFEQSPPPQRTNAISNSRYENYPLRVWERSLLRQLHRTVTSHLKINDGMREAVDGIRERFRNWSILGVHFRKTDHFNEVQPVDDEVFLRLVDRRIASFDRLFLATDDADIVSLFEKRYGDKLLCNPFSRSRGSVSLHHSDEGLSGYELGKEALLDCYSLSLCDQAILSPSNLSYCALVLNPELPYLLAESRSAKWYRLKTSGAYHLNRWGIRRW